MNNNNKNNNIKINNNNNIVTHQETIFYKHQKYLKDIHLPSN